MDEVGDGSIPPETIQKAISTIREILDSNPDFHNKGLLTAKIGDDFKLKYPTGESFKFLFPDMTITRFMKEHLSDYVNLVPDEENPIKIFVRSKTAAVPEKSTTINAASIRSEGIRLPRKLFKLRAFLMTLTTEELSKFNFDGNMILSLMREEI